jgi:hypothetical protein
MMSLPPRPLPRRPFLIQLNTLLPLLLLLMTPPLPMPLLPPPARRRFRTRPSTPRPPLPLATRSTSRPLSYRSQCHTPLLLINPRLCSRRLTPKPRVCAWLIFDFPLSDVYLKWWRVFASNSLPLNCPPIMNL